jgi:hypothetical protein
MQRRTARCLCANPAECHNHNPRATATSFVARSVLTEYQYHSIGKSLDPEICSTPEDYSREIETIQTQGTRRGSSSVR